MTDKRKADYAAQSRLEYQEKTLSFVWIICINNYNVLFLSCYLWIRHIELLFWLNISILSLNKIIYASLWVFSIPIIWFEWYRAFSINLDFSFHVEALPIFYEINNAEKSCKLNVWDKRLRKLEVYKPPSRSNWVSFEYWK